MNNEQAKLKILQRCKEDFLYFAKLITPKSFYLDTPEFHKEIADIFMNRENIQVCLRAPRGFAKSTLAIRFILHHILFDPGDKVIILQSKTRPEAINRLTSIKNILEYSSIFKDLFGYAGEFSEETSIWREDKIKTKLDKYEISVKAIGTGQPARGTLETSKELEDTRITLYFLDDPDDEDNTKTKEAMVANYSKFSGNKEGLDKRTGRVLVMGTPVRMGCLVDRLYGSAGWFSKTYKARWIEDGERKLLWEEMRDWDWLQEKFLEYKEAGTLSKYYSEFECEVVGEEDQLFKEEYIQSWDGTLQNTGEENFLHITHLNEREVTIIKPVNVFIGIDPASSTAQTADFSVTMPIAYDADGLIYVLPYYRKRVAPTAHAEQIIETIKHLKPARGYVETVGYQEMLRVYLRQRLEEEGLYLAGLERKFNPRTEKSQRLNGLHPLFYNKKVYFKEGMQEFIDELLYYPRGRHDDLIDGFYYATRGLMKPDHLTAEMDDSKHFAAAYINQPNWRTV